MNNVNKLWIVNRIGTFKWYNKSKTIKTKICICKSQDDSKLRNSEKKKKKYMKKIESNKHC